MWPVLFQREREILRLQDELLAGTHVPRLRQNPQSSRETELSQLYPLHVVTAWLGNSEAVATKYELQVIDFERAASEVSGPVRKPVWYGTESSCMPKRRLP